MKNQIELVAFHLPKSLKKSTVEKTLGVTLTKGIEATYYAEAGDSLITYTQFNVLTMINYTHEKVHETFKALAIEETVNFGQDSIYQDYPVCIAPELSMPFSIDNEKITLKEYSRINLIIIAHVISQSVALALYEQKLSQYYEQSRSLIDAADTFSMFKRSRLAHFSKQLILIRHDMLIELQLLDKPNILWDNETAEMLYNQLAYSLELKDRFDIVEYKLNNIKDDIVMVMDLSNHNHSSFLEWIIIILIMIEIVMGLYEWFGPGLSH